MKTDRANPGALPARVSDWPEEWLYAVRERHGIMREDPTKTDAEHRRLAEVATRAEYRRKESL